MTGGWWYLARFYPAGKALKKASQYLLFFFLYSIKHRTWRDFRRGILDTLLGLPMVLRGRRVVSPEAVRMLESKPYETSLLKYGSIDTVDNGWANRGDSRWKHKRKTIF